MPSDPAFRIPHRPERRYPRTGGVEYEGETVFALTPESERSDEKLATVVEGVLDGPAYTYGDWFDLPMPLYLVHDRETGDVFRIAIRDGRVELHVLPGTGSEGLRAVYDRLRETTGLDWEVDRRTDG